MSPGVYLIGALAAVIIVLSLLAALSGDLSHACNLGQACR